ncbi:hypothetical protein RRSWK_06076 [Rhodopirellula sp. SWK7]|nr:hypothetical protein RRSWK_06076 [Rhodopirellula sp. SWK7]
MRKNEQSVGAMNRRLGGTGRLSIMSSKPSAYLHRNIRESLPLLCQLMIQNVRGRTLNRKECEWHRGG